MSEAKLLTKDDTFWKVLNNAIVLDFRRGHLRWSMSELSRSSGITRSLIYYYFGKSKEEILREAVKLVGEELFGLNANRMAMWEQGNIGQSILATRELMLKSPQVMAFYVVHRTAQGEIGEAIRTLEREYLAKISKYFSGADKASVEALYGLFLGLVLAPTMSDVAVETAINVVLSVANKQGAH